MTILVKNCRIIDPSQKLDKKGDILIENGKIAQIGETIKKKADTTIDANGRIAGPGFIDMHTHLREPGREDKETIDTGLKAAIAGGFTTVCPMPNTEPPCDNQAQVRFLLDRAGEVKLANILPVGTITKKREGEQLTEMGELKQAGCLAVSDDGDSIADSGLMRIAMEYASMVNLLVISHCEDKGLASDGVMHEGYWSTVLGLRPIPAEAESTIVERDIRLAELAGARLHIAHVSAGKSVEAIRQAKERGLSVSAEVTPHHFTLTDEEIRSFDANLKVNPPLRSEDDIKAIKKGIKAGVIDVIATDHAPHLANEKEKEFDYAPFGMIGLETAFSLTLMNLVDKKVLDWTGLFEKLSTNPAKILQYDRGTLKEGAVADITIIDPDAEWDYTIDKVQSLSKNSPFIDKKMKGKVTEVIVGGEIVFEGGKLV